MVFEKCARFFPADFCSSTPLLGKHMCTKRNHLFEQISCDNYYAPLVCRYIAYESQGFRIWALVGGLQKSPRPRPRPNLDMRAGWQSAQASRLALMHW